VVAAIAASLAARSLSIRAAVRHPANAADLTSEVARLREAGCDAIYLYSLGADAARFFKTANELSWRLPVIGGRWLAARSFLATAGATADGLIIPAVADPTKAPAKAFIAAYDRKYGGNDDPAHVYSALGYDSMRLLAAGLEQSGATGGIKLAAALETLSISDGATGRAGSTLTFGTHRHDAPSRDFLVFYEIRGSAYRFLTSDVASGR
jgi:branched-chain amino acid transport system substrate-binding protein